MNNKLYWIIILNTLVAVCCLELITTFSSLAVSAISYLMSDSCKDNECCNNEWLQTPSLSDLENVISSKVFGQHLINKHVSTAVIHHIKTNNPASPLVMSFHGGTGTGKNFVSQIIAESIFKKGLNSKFVRVIRATKHFPNKNKLEEYKNELSRLIENSAKLCERTLFIFDEFHEMPIGLGDSIAPFLDYNNQLDGIDYRKNIFIFLSNTTADIINSYTLKHYENRNSRESLTNKYFEYSIIKNALNSSSGFNDSKLIKKALIKTYVAFLPLERKHVKQCAEELIKKETFDIKNSTLEAIADEVFYFPEKEQWFSLNGCKRLEAKVADFLSR
ncbi:torsin-1A [Hydra vulgaris]|uniref:torsin-1A n=1 Tax=Hydra vulgaris TaxID=6087 RepID=UPI0006410A9E|nr:torsin-1A [Hydra vulgaris]